MYMRVRLSEYKPWSGAVDTYNRIMDEDKWDDFECLLQDLYCDREPTETDINALLWFEPEWVYEALGIKE